MGKWRKIDKLLKVKELKILFGIPYSEFVFARDIKVCTLANFYRVIDKLDELDLVEVRQATRLRRARTYRRTFRYYRVSADGNGSFIVEVRD
jgi:hypothetical protein